MRPRWTELHEIVLPLLESPTDEPPRRDAAAEVERRLAEALSWLERAEDDRWSFKKLGLAVPDDSELHITSSHALERAARLFSETPDPTGAIEDLYNGFVELNVRSNEPFADDMDGRMVADWFLDYQLASTQVFLKLDPVAYERALGTNGLEQIRERVEELRAHQQAPEEPGTGLRRTVERLLVTWLDQRLAVLDADHAAIIRTHLGEGTSAADLDNVAAAFEEIGEWDQAIQWAKSATMFDLEWQAYRAAKRWLRLTEYHHPEDAEATARRIFQRWPNSHTGCDLYLFAEIADIRREFKQRRQLMAEIIAADLP